MSDIFVKIRQLILLAGDIIALYLALFLSLLARYGNEFGADIWSSHITPFSAVYSIWIIVFYINGLYDLRRAKNNIEFGRLFFTSLAINALIATGFFYLVPSIGIAPKTNLFLTLLFVIILFYGWRTAFNALVISTISKTKILFLGNMTEFEGTINYIREEPQLGYEIADIISPDSTSDLKQIIADKKVNIIVLGQHLQESSELAHSLYETIFSRISFVDFVTFSESLTGRIPVHALSESWFLENLKEADKRFYNGAKRTTDLLLSLILGVVLLLLLPIIALLIKINDQGNIFYTQKRIGLGGKEYVIWKFRTMIENAESAGAQFAGMNDSRITAVGKFLRKTRLDELPQVWNILSGEMSFIGPRPERPEFVAELTRQMPFYAVRHLIKPGLTGWAQINYPYAGTFEENLNKLQYDLYYIKNRSILLDITIIFKTLNIVLRFKGR